LRAAWLAAVVGLSLAACGGSSGSGGGSVLPPPPPSPGPINWGAPTTLASNTQISAVAAAVATDGTASVAWPQTQVVLPNTTTPTPVPYVVGRSQAATGTAWSALQVLESFNAGNAATDAVAELHGSGAGPSAVFAWRRTTSALDRLAAARRDASVSSDAVVNEAPLALGMNGVALASNDAGDQVLAWSQAPSSGALAQVYVSRRSGAGAWSAPLLLQANAGAAGSEPAVAVDAAGRVLVVWRQGSPNAQLWSRVIEAGGTLGTPLQVDLNQLNDARNPRLAVLATNQFMLTWEQGQAGATGYDLRATRWTGAGWLAAPATIDTGVGSVLDARVVSGALQGATVVWRQDNLVQAARFSASNGNWSVPVQLSASLTGTAQDLRVASDAAGNAIVVWTQRPPGGVNELYGAQLSASTGGFSAPAALESNAGGVGSPVLALNGTGTAVVAWLQSVAGQVNPDLVARVARP
jgi:hypothetical protein